MPNWQPNWNNVRWNWGAADAAVNALRHAADRLDSSASERSGVAREAQAEWRGRYRDEFDGKLDQMLRQARELANQHRDAANRIASASCRAWDEQRRRENDRARWYREREEEERRRREEEERRRQAQGRH